MTRGFPPRTVFKLILVWLSIEAACYFSAASMHVTAWTGGSVQSIALLPGAWTLATSVIFSTIVVGAGYRVGERLTPLVLLLVLALPYVPYAISLAPALLVFAGPAKWIVVIVAIAGCAKTTGVAKTSDVVPDLSRALRRSHMFLVSLAIYLAIGIPFSRVEGPGGDEPHYLVIAHSLLVDRDLQIENNHRLRHYEAFVGGDLPMHYLHRGRGGVIYSVHSPGLPAIVLPAYAIAGYLGAVVTVSLLAALLAVAVYDLALLVADPMSALVTWIAVAFTVPIVPHAWLIYPELPAALIGAWVALWVWRSPPASIGVWLMRGAAMSIWPWLHTKFLLLLMVAIGCFALKLRSRLVPLIALAAPIAVSGALWLFSFWAMYGVASPFVQYGSADQSDMSLANVPRGLFGLLFDYKFGVLIYSPVYAVVAAGVWTLLKDERTRWETIALLGLSATLVASITPYTMWWGGRSAPARFLVPAVPFLVPALAAGMAWMRELRLTSLRTGLVVWGVGAVGLMALRPDLHLLFNERQTPGRLITFLQGEAPLSYALPMFAQPAFGMEIVKAAIWLVVAGVALAALYRRGRGAALACVVISLGATASLMAVPLSVADRDQVVNRGRERLMADYQAGETAVTYPAIRGTTVAAWLEQSMLSSTSGGAFNLPPGRYLARIWLRDGSREYDGTITLIDRPGVSRIAARAGPFRSPIEMPFTLPVTDTRVSVAASGPVAAAVMRSEIVPRALTDRSARPTITANALYAIGGREGAYVIYVDDSVFAEGEYFWTRGGAPGRTFVAPAGARRLRLSLSAGASNGRVRLDVDGRHEDVELNAGQTRTWETAIDPAVTLVPLTITTSGGFRPAETDPQSTDRRWLGCQVRVTLQEQ